MGVGKTEQGVFVEVIAGGGVPPYQFGIRRELHHAFRYHGAGKSVTVKASANEWVHVLQHIGWRWLLIVVIGAAVI